ncbi:MAG: 3-phosphoserine/phosphohydroxythreonine transaminase [Pseudomonadota bacterium]|nr:3-phosphoserine/phosphohydroxythreonine transaminase [Pseudomonadota bacterium]
MTRAYNFSAGPSMLPESVLNQVRDELLDWHGLGASVMEISHRGTDFRALAAESEADCRQLLKIPNNYHVLFVQGGGRGQFSMVPMNLLRGRMHADYINTGVWSKLAAREAEKYCVVNQVVKGETSIPDQNSWQLDNYAAYVHYVDNETVNGIEFPYIPDVGDVPLVSDMSSNLLSRPFDVSRFGLVYAGVQKNIGPAGLALVIVREDLIGQALPTTPCLYDYQNHVNEQSLYNTPPTFSWYVCSLVFKWLLAQGGVEAIAEVNARKAKKLYDYLDQSEFYSNNIDPPYRSRMNVVFRLRDEERNEAFLAGAQRAGLLYLAGHKLVGGMRASMYNAMPEAGVDALLNYMDEFRQHE